MNFSEKEKSLAALKPIIYMANVKEDDLLDNDNNHTVNNTNIIDIKFFFKFINKTFIITPSNSCKIYVFMLYLLHPFINRLLHKPHTKQSLENMKFSRLLLF